MKHTNAGVFSFKEHSLKTFKHTYINEQESTSWGSVFLAVAITLLVVAGASSAMRTVQARVDVKNSSKESFLFEGLRKLAMVNIAEAATVSNTLDRSKYYEQNANLYKPTPKKVVAVKSTVKKVVPVKTVAKTSISKKTTTAKAAIAKPAVKAVAKLASTDMSLATGSKFGATRLIQSAQSVTVAANERLPFDVGFKNTGTTTWTVGDMPTVTLRSSAKGESYFHDATWEAKNIAVSIKDTTKPGEVGYFHFILGAPAKTGSYNEVLYLTRGDEKIAGSEFTLPIQVVAPTPKVQVAKLPAKVDAVKTTSVTTFKEATASDSASTTNTVNTSVPPSTTPIVPSTTTPTSGIVTDIRAVEKMIRVGLFAATGPTQITANKDYDVRDGNGVLISTEKAGAITTVTFDATTKQYAVTTPSVSTTITTYVRFTGANTSPTAVPDQDTVFEIPSYINHPGWSSTLNDNKFRAALEVRYAAKSGKVWVINELLMEQYLKGLGETSNGSPYEYQKALLIAARTYAQYHIDRDTKYLSENFTVRNTDADQVYHGYNSEIRMPNLVRGLNETRGIIVTYQGKLAITPYFSQSDGRTRNWTEVWGGSGYPWLVGVPDPLNAGLPMLGHGVGMSARGALLMANQGKGFEEILKYYYTGVDLTKIFN